MAEETLEERIAKLEKENQSYLPKGVRELMTLLSPVILALMGYWFTAELNSTSQLIEKNELETRRLEVTQSLLNEVFDGGFDKTAAMKKLLSKIIKDEDLSQEIGATVEDYLERKVEELTDKSRPLTKLEERQLERLEKASRTLEADGEGKVREASRVFIVTQSLSIHNLGTRGQSIKKAKALREVGYADAQVWRSETGDGYYALVLARLPAAEARSLLNGAISDGDARTDAYLTKGTQFVEQVWPEAD